MAGTKPITVDRFAGLRNDVPAEHMRMAGDAGTDLALGVNVDLNDAGRLSRRSGYAQTMAGSGVHSLFSNRDGSVTLVVVGDTIRKVAADGASATQLGSGLTPGARMSYAEGINRIYHCNGHENGVYENGAVRSWGLSRHAAPALSATAGVLPAGKYAVVCTYVAADGQESGAGTGTEITLANEGGIAVSLVASTNARVSEIRVYCTTADGAQFFLAGVATNASSTFTIEGPQSRLQRPLTTQFYNRAPVGHLCAVYRGRAYVAVDDRLHYSSAFGLELFRDTDYIAMGGRISMIAPTLDGIYVGCPDGTFWLSGMAPESFTVVRAGAAAVEGSATYARAASIGGMTGEFDIPVWLSEDGPTVGTPGGSLSVVNKNWRPGAVDRSAGIVREAGDTFQYLASLGD